MARRDLTGAVEFEGLEAYAAGDLALVDEVLDLFAEQAALWGRMLAEPANWRDAAHTLKGAARGVHANQLAAACETLEQTGPASLASTLSALDAALLDIAAYRHQRLLNQLKG